MASNLAPNEQDKICCKATTLPHLPSLIAFAIYPRALLSGRALAVDKRLHELQTNRSVSNIVHPLKVHQLPGPSFALTAMDGGNADIAGAIYLSFIKSILQTISQRSTRVGRLLTFVPGKV